jgi:glycosyltransferase involved in cell wall biosynthesis
LKKRILLVINTLDIGGAETLLNTHAEYFVNKQYEVYLVTLKEYKDNFLSERILEIIKKENYTNLNFNNYFEFKKLKEFNKIVRLINPNKIISHLEFSNIVTSIICFFKYSKHHISFEHVHQYGTYSFFRKLVKKITYQSNKINIAVSKQVENDLRQQLNITNTVTLDNFIADRFFNNYCSLIATNKFRNTFNLNCNDFIMISIGRLEEQKNCLNLIDDIGSFFNIAKNAKLLIVGEGSQKDELINKINHYNLAKQIIIIEPIPNVEQLLDLSTIYISYSIYEGFGLTIIEAMARRKKILTTKTFGPNIYIEDSINGYFIDKTNLTDTLKRIYDENDNILNKDIENNAFLTAANFKFEKHMNILERYL